MKLKRLKFSKGFRVIRGNAGSQAAEMVIPPGEGEGDPRNRHRGADQWLFVVEGHGEARMKRRRYKLAPGSLLLVERGERHEIRNTGRTSFVRSTSTCRRLTTSAATSCRGVNGREA